MNLYHLEKNWQKNKEYVYIGRAGKDNDGFFGNPHPIGYCAFCGKTHNRNESVEAFRATFTNRLRIDPVFVERVKQLQGKKLVCFCVNEKIGRNGCHGGVIADYLDSQLGEKNE